MIISPLAILIIFPQHNSKVEDPQEEWLKTDTGIVHQEIPLCDRGAICLSIEKLFIENRLIRINNIKAFTDQINI